MYVASRQEVRITNLVELALGASEEAAYYARRAAETQNSETRATLLALSAGKEAACKRYHAERHALSR